MKQSASQASKQLEQSFQLFNQVSAQLSETYRELEARVATLSAELDQARAQGRDQGDEKRRVADRFHTLLKALPAGAVVLDGAGRVQECNPAAEDLLGEPLCGESWVEVIKRAFAPRLGEVHEVSLRDGRLVSISTQPLGEEPGQIVLLHDVTEARALQERLNRHKRLSAMGEMAASLAHQIRTPMSAATLYASQLKNARLDEAGRVRFAGKVLASLNHLESMVNDMLIFAKGGSAGDDDIELGELLGELYESMEAALTQANAELSIDQPVNRVCLRGNRQALLGALQNLINNAIQACDKDARLHIGLAHARARAEAPGVLLSVSDNGPGIAADVRERLFEPFFTTRSRGTGLGLAVVQAVARAHDGAVWVESEPGQGATFTLFLPVQTENERARHASTPRGATDAPPIHDMARAAGI